MGNHHRVNRFLWVLIATVIAFSNFPGFLYAEDIPTLTRRLQSVETQMTVAGMGEKEKLLKELTDVAQRRQEELISVLRQDPAQFFRHVMREDERKALQLPPSVEERLEQNLESEGTYELAQLDDFIGPNTRKMHLFRPLQNPNRVYELHFGNNPPPLKTGSRIHLKAWFVGDHAVVASGATTNDPSTQTGFEVTQTAPVAAGAATGAQTVLAIVVAFYDQTPNTTAAGNRSILFTDANSVANYYKDTSFGQLTFTGDVAGPLKISLPSTGNCADYLSDGSAWATAANSKATAAGFNVNSYNHRLYIFQYPNACSSTYGGIAAINGSWAIDFYGGYSGHESTAAHELGHNLGMFHASTSSDEYGDYSDVMGNNWNSRLSHVNAPHKIQMGWLPSGRTQVISSPGTSTITLNLLEKTDGASTQAIKIHPQIGEMDFYIGHRVPVGFDSTFLQSQFRYASTVQTWSGGKTYLQATLLDGQSYNDATTGVHITQVSHNATKNTALLSITLDSFPPVLWYVDPNTGPTAGGTSVTINGANFVSPVTVMIGGVSAANIVWVSATQLTATTPAGTAGAKNVTVTNPDTQTGTLTGGFTYGSDQIAIVTPAAGAVLSGFHEITASVITFDTINQVEFFFNNGAENISMGIVTTPPYKTTWDTSRIPDGNYSLTTQATIKSAQRQIRTCISNSIPVSVANQISCQIPSLTNGATYFGNVNIDVDAMGLAGIKEVTLYVGVDSFVLIPSPSYRFTWETPKKNDGPYIVWAKAVDNGGNVAFSSIYRVSVNNWIDCAVTSPVSNLSGTPLVGQVNYVVQTAAAMEINKVEFYIDGNLEHETSVGAGNVFTYSWDTSGVSNSTHTLYAKAYDYASTMNNPRVVKSPDVLVFVQNPILQGFINPYPAVNAFVPSDQPLEIKAVFGSVQVPDEGRLVGDTLRNSLKVWCTQSAETFRIPGGVSYTGVAGGGGVLQFSGNVPDNCSVEWEVRAPNASGAVLYGRFPFIRPMAKSIGGTINSKDGILLINIPPGALPKDLIINISTDIPGGTIPAEGVIAGPYEVKAYDESAITRFTNLLKSAQITYTIPSAPAGIGPNDRVVQIQECEDGSNNCHSVGATAQEVSPSASSSQVKQGYTTHLSMFRLISFVNLGTGMTQLINYPNPFNPNEGGTKFHYFLSRDSNVSFTVYDLFGNLVKTMNAPLGGPGGTAGENNYRWDGRNGEGRVVANGGYVAHVMYEDASGNKSKFERKLLVIK